jgi:hypothetical protein
MASTVRVGEHLVGKGGEEEGRVAYLDEKSAVVRRERREDILEDFAESGAVDTCHTRREPRFASSPALDAQMDPRATYDERP